MDTPTPAKKYQEGVRLAHIDTREYLGNTNDDFCLKYLIVQAVPTESGWELITHIEVEVYEYGEVLYVDYLPTMYRMPFPLDLQVRKCVLRLIADKPNWYEA